LGASGRAPRDHEDPQLMAGSGRRRGHEA
jgi:hypothetical protein